MPEVPIQAPQPGHIVLPPPDDAPRVEGVRLARVPGFAFYLAGDDGSVWSVWSGRWERLEPFPATCGHLRVNLLQAHRPKSKIPFYVHQIVAMAFLGPPPPGMEVCHMDDDKWNNKLSNLYYGTKFDNREDFRLNKSLR